MTDVASSGPRCSCCCVLIPLGLLLDRAHRGARRASERGSPVTAASRCRRPRPDRPARGRVAPPASPAALSSLGLTVMLVALARPQAVVSLPRPGGHGRPRIRRVGQHGRDRLSQPTRMEAAKAAAKAFVQRQPDGVVVGVVAFSDSGLVGPDPDPATRRPSSSAIDRLQPQRGTSLGQGILASLNAITVAETGRSAGLLHRTARRPRRRHAGPGRDRTRRR